MSTKQVEERLEEYERMSLLMEGIITPETLKGTLPEIDVGKVVRDWLDKTLAPEVRKLFDRIIGDMRKISENIIKGNIKDAVSVAFPYALTSLGIVLGIELLQTKVAGFGIEIRKFVDKVDRLVSPELVFSALTGVMIGRGVELPASYFFNSVFTPSIPSPNDIAQMYYENKITYEDAKRYMSFHGFSEDFMKKLFDIWDFTPSFYTIERFYRTYPMDNELLEEFFKKNRIVNPKHKEYYKNYLNWMVIRDELYKVESAIRDLYVKGFIDKGTLKKYLWDIKRHEQERYWFERYSDLLREKKLMELQMNTYIYLYRRGIYDELTLLEKLKEIGVDPTFAEAYVSYEASKRGIEWYPPAEVAPS